MNMNDSMKRQLINRLKRIEGQVRGLQKMVDDNVYCINIITQTSAVRNSLRACEDVILENHLKTCAAHQMQHGETHKAVSEILKVYKLKK